MSLAHFSEELVTVEFHRASHETQIAAARILKHHGSSITGE
jgi:hypothetical protein